MLNYDDPAFYVLPDSKQMASQNLLLYEMSLPFGMSLDNQINFDKSASNLRVQIDNLRSKELIALTDRIDVWLGANAPEGFSAVATGPDYMFSKITFRTISSMLGGLVVAILLISLCLIAALKSWKLGALSLIPNVIPLFMTFGLWAIFVGEIGLISSSVSVIGLGLIIDDMVHFLSKYQRARQVLNYDV